MTRLGAALSLVLLLACVGCSNDDDPDVTTEANPSSTPSPTASPTATPTASPTCLGVSTDQLAEWSGLPQELTESSDTDATRCVNLQDEAGMQVEWEYPTYDSTFTELGERADLPGLERSRIELGGGTPGWLLSGTAVQYPQASVVALIDGRPFEVVARTYDVGIAEPADLDTLLRVAKGVAAAQLR
ncbi:hypothetical protein [Nocardioides houyundeii]|uniref:hypothetical protein n=1 Tax=Nocardioides houyundeii TaxID=2045452 RepID=UPI000C791076|nr:hypothetical protein [Nocardioides houyundeii]